MKQPLPYQAKPKQWANVKLAPNGTVKSLLQMDKEIREYFDGKSRQPRNNNP